MPHRRLRLQAHSLGRAERQKREGSRPAGALQKARDQVQHAALHLLPPFPQKHDLRHYRERPRRRLPHQVAQKAQIHPRSQHVQNSATASALLQRKSIHHALLLRRVGQSVRPHKATQRRALIFAELQVQAASKLAVGDGAGDGDKLQLNERAHIFFSEVIEVM